MEGEWGTSVNYCRRQFNALWCFRASADRTVAASSPRRMLVRIALIIWDRFYKCLCNDGDVWLNINVGGKSTMRTRAHTHTQLEWGVEREIARGRQKKKGRERVDNFRLKTPLDWQKKKKFFNVLFFTRSHCVQNCSTVAWKLFYYSTVSSCLFPPTLRLQPVTSSLHPPFYHPPPPRPFVCSIALHSLQHPSPKHPLPPLFQLFFLFTVHFPSCRVINLFIIIFFFFTCYGPIYLLPSCSQPV